MTKDCLLIPLSSVCTSYGRGKTPKYVERSDKYVINQACVYWDGIKLENVKYHNPDTFKPANIIPENAVLLNSTGTGTLGRAHVFDVEKREQYMADSHVSILVPEQITPIVLQYYFYDERTQVELYRTCVNGSTSQAELSKEALGRMMVPVPDMEKQKMFEAFVKQSDKSKYCERKRKMIQFIRSIQEVQNDAK